MKNACIYFHNDKDLMLAKWSKAHLSWKFCIVTNNLISSCHPHSRDNVWNV